MTDRITDILEAADWVRRSMREDVDVKAVFDHALLDGGYSGLADFARDDPRRFFALYEACVDMVEQIPEHQLRPAQTGEQ